MTGNKSTCHGIQYYPEAFTTESHEYADLVVQNKSFYQVFVRYLLSIVFDITQLVHSRNEVVLEIQRILENVDLPKGLPLTSILWCALSQMSDKYFNEKATQYGWSEIECNKIKADWYELIASAFVPANNSRRLETSIIKNWTQNFLVLHKRDKGPLSMCNFCTSKCFYDYDVSQLVTFKTESSESAAKTSSIAADIQYAEYMSQHLTANHYNSDLAFCIAAHLIPEKKVSEKLSNDTWKKIKEHLDKNPNEKEYEQEMDLYDWLMDSKSEETMLWIEDQREKTKTFFKDSAVHAVKNRLEQIQEFETYQLPWKQGTKIFYLYNKNTANKDRNVLYVIDKLGNEPRTVIDYNAWPEDKKGGPTVISDDGSFIAYSFYNKKDLSKRYWMIKNVVTGKDYDETICTRFSDTRIWAKDNSGFYYSHYETDSNSRENWYGTVYFHKLGTAQTQDRLVCKTEKWINCELVAIDKNNNLVLLLISASKPSHCGLAYVNLNSDDTTIHDLVDRKEIFYRFIQNDDCLMMFITDLDAPNRRLISIDITDKEIDKYSIKEILAETNDILVNVHLGNDSLTAVYRKDAYHQLKEFSVNGSFIRDITLPGIGVINGFSVYDLNGAAKDNIIYYDFECPSKPPSIYRLDYNTGKSDLIWEPKVCFNPDNYVTKQLFCTSKDGTKIPIFLSYRKDIRMNASAPVLLEGYGGFGTPQLPTFSARNILWMETGGIFVSACVRGGGEYGNAWYKSGKALNRQNAFDDFVAVAQWLIKNRYTSNKNLAAFGESNGGLLVAACMTQRPDLFGAVCLAGPLTDMLGYQKMGGAWFDEYGTVNNTIELQALYSYSPLHNIKQNTSYPATYVMTSVDDSIVSPAHAFKFAASLQNAQSSSAAIILNTGTNWGHGESDDEAIAYRLAFLLKVLKIPL
jgi:prolyl oligopeptidase